MCLRISGHSHEASVTREGGSEEGTCKYGALAEVLDINVDSENNGFIKEMQIKRQPSGKVFK